ncbi:MAG: hypothetical protein ACLSHA_08170 [Neglectibacter timonensis]
MGHKTALDEAGFAGARGADEGHGLPLFGPEAHMLHHTSGGVRIAEGHIPEFHLSLPAGKTFLAGAVCDGGMGFQYLQHPLAGYGDPGPDDIDHHQHHEGCHHLHGIGGENHHVGKDIQPLCHSCPAGEGNGPDEVGAYPVNSQGQAVHN